MSLYISIHPESPQARLVKQAAEIIRQGGVVAYPTDSGYALGCHLGDKNAQQRIRAIRRIEEDHWLSLVCRDLKELSLYAKVDNIGFRLLRNNTPGAYTFILPATREVPRRLMNEKRRTIGLRIPQHAVTLAILEELGEPMLSTTLIMPGDDFALAEPWEIQDAIGHSVDAIIDGGYCAYEPSTVIDMTADVPEVLRVGTGDPSPFE